MCRATVYLDGEKVMEDVIWLEHNQERTAEFGNWADRASLAGQEVAAQEIRRAAEAMQQASDALQSAPPELGGAIHLDHHAHSH